MASYNYNYIEFYLKKNQTITYDIDTFNELLQKTKNIVIENKKLGFPFKKTRYEEYYEDFVHFQMFDTYEAFDNNQKALKESILVMNPVSIEHFSKKLPIFDPIVRNEHLLTLVFNKEELPLCNYPSTSKSYEKCLDQRLSFKINNRLYLNFSTKQYASDPQKLYHSIFFNYNLSDRLDLTAHVQSIQKIVVELIKLFWDWHPRIFKIGIGVFST